MHQSGLDCLPPKGQHNQFRVSVLCPEDTVGFDPRRGIKPTVTVPSFYSVFFKDYQIHLPPLTTQQQEVDYIEETQSGLYAWEFKWKTKGKVRFPKTFAEAYPQCTTAIVTPDNFEGFLLLPRDRRNERTTPDPS